MPLVYDNWQRLVEAALDREKLRELARSPSLSSSISDSSSRISFDSTIQDVSEHIERGINGLTSELEMMRAHLKDADAKGGRDHQNQEWIRQLREKAHKIEDVFDAFEYQQAQNILKSFAGWTRKNSHSIDDAITTIKEEIKSIKEMKDTYQDGNNYHASSSSESSGIAALSTREEEIVGIEEPISDLSSLIFDKEKVYKVMFVVGMGGSGKTTLVKAVFEELKEYFDCFLWLTASKSVEEILSILWSELCNQTLPCSTYPFEVLIPMIRDYLEHKKYLVVLDDLRCQDVWNSVQYAFPRVNCSRVIITTRRGDIAASSCSQDYVHVYKIKPLPRESARELFHKRACPQSDGPPTSPGLVSWFEKLLEKCQGLPLAIVEIGNLLSTGKRLQSEFKKLHDSLQSELKLSGKLSRIRQVLVLSYDDLPYRLKCCFLYMSMFPEGYAVKRTTLIRMWISEGFVERESEKQVEDIGEEYLKELMDRNLIEASELDFDGRPKSCRVHNLMHKIVLSKAEDENFCNSGEVSENTRRVSIKNNKFDMSNKNMPCARTLFNSRQNLKTPPRLHSSMNLLKTLHLDGARVDVFPKGIDELLLLKYLCLSNTKIKVVPATIGRLRFLETLNLKQTFVTALPDSVANLEKLEHLLVYRYDIKGYMSFDAVKGFKAPSRIGKLTNLRKLCFVKADKNHNVIFELRNLKELRRLGVIDLPTDGGSILCNTIQRLTNLHSLALASGHEDEVLDIQAIDNPPPHLKRLYLKGRLEKIPDWIPRINDLVRICLKWSRLPCDDNPINILQDLPNLLELQLLDAYTGSKLEFNANKYKKLENLRIERMESLSHIVIHKESLPRLRNLIIVQCHNLTEIPLGVVNLVRLEKLYLDMPADFVDPLRRGGGMRTLVQHVQNIYSIRLRDDRQWATESLS